MRFILLQLQEAAMNELREFHYMNWIERYPLIILLLFMFLPYKDEQILLKISQSCGRLLLILRGPNGCPWDKEQTHESLKKYLIEETYEVIEAIDNDDIDHLIEELGDVLLR